MDKKEYIDSLSRISKGIFRIVYADREKLSGRDLEKIISEEIKYLKTQIIE